MRRANRILLRLQGWRSDIDKAPSNLGQFCWLGWYDKLGGWNWLLKEHPGGDSDWLDEFPFLDRYKVFWRPASIPSGPICDELTLRRRWRRITRPFRHPPPPPGPATSSPPSQGPWVIYDKDEL